jgi:hypothetical protein
MRFVNAKGDVAEEKREKPREKSCEDPQPKPKPRPIRFHCGYYGRDGHNEEFFFKRKREKKMVKEWANKDRYHPSHGAPKSRMSLPRGNAIVCTVPAWGAKSALGGIDLAGWVKPVRPVLNPVRLVWGVHIGKPARPIPELVRPVWR